MTAVRLGLPRFRSGDGERMDVGGQSGREPLEPRELALWSMAWPPGDAGKSAGWQKKMTWALPPRRPELRARRERTCSSVRGRGTQRSGQGKNKDGEGFGIAVSPGLLTAGLVPELRLCC
jgi:hypothetical protein